MRRFQPSMLFEAWKPGRRPDPYPTLVSELDAVSAGQKGMSMFGFTEADLTSGDPDVVKLLRMASDRGLVIALHCDPVPGLSRERQWFRFYVARPGRLWRVPAHLTLWKTAFGHGAWTEAQEAQEGLLLGYTRKQIREWLEYSRYQRAAWGCATIYALLDQEQVRLVRSLGKRCFGPPSAMARMRFFWPGGTLKRGAFRLLPKGITLARVGLENAVFYRLFGKPPRVNRGVATVAITEESSAGTTAAFTTGVQLLTASGWK